MRVIRSLSFIIQHPLNRRRPLTALARFALWQLSSRMVSRSVVVEYVNGSRLLVERGMTSATGALYTGLLEYSDMAFVLHALRSGDQFIDVGANIGSYTVLAASVPGVGVTAFEPDEGANRCLTDSVLLNRFQDRVTVHRLGVGSGRSTLRFTRGQGQVNHVVSDDRELSNSVEIQIVPLDEMVRPTAPTMIKMDVEGFEAEVIAGALGVLAHPQLKVLLVEFNGSGGRYGKDERVLQDRLDALGYHHMAYDPARRALVEPSAAPYPSKNKLLVRDVTWASERVRDATRFRIRGQVI